MEAHVPVQSCDLVHSRNRHIRNIRFIDNAIAHCGNTLSIFTRRVETNRFRMRRSDEESACGDIAGCGDFDGLFCARTPAAKKSPEAIERILACFLWQAEPDELPLAKQGSATARASCSSKCPANNDDEAWISSSG
jgi:hypothetical protein